MTKIKMYRYLGRNGIITSTVFIEKADPIIMYELRANTGKILMSGDHSKKSVLVFEDEINDWVEVDDPNYVEVII